MASKHTMDLTKGNVTKQLFAFAVPTILSNLLQHCYNIADKVVVGQFAQNGAQALAAIGASSSTTALVLNMCTGLALGANVRCSNMRGAGDIPGQRKSMHTAVLLSVILGAALSVIGLIVTKPILRMLGTPEQIFDLGAEYLYYYLPDCCLHLYIILEQIYSGQMAIPNDQWLFLLLVVLLMWRLILCWLYSLT